jgi:hypothetical protein
MSRRFGFKFSENMYGTYTPTWENGAERRFIFHVDAFSDNLLRTLRDGKVETVGHVEAEGLAAHAPLRGFMIIKPLLARVIRYEFQFTGDDGAAYRFAGEKTIRHLHPFRTWTTLPGSIYDSGDREIAQSMVRFDRREMVPFLRSFKPWLCSARPQPADA